MTTAVIVQARWGSSRSRGKVLENIGGTTVLEYGLSRVARIPGVDCVVCAVPLGESNDPVAEEAHRVGAQVFRGSEHDVLARYHGAALMAKADTVMRVTSDCPIIDPAVCGEVLALLRREGVDYAANNMPPSYPHGLDCEAFTFDALDAAFKFATEPYDREHVTPWIRRAGHLRRFNLEAADRSLVNERWTLDFPEDLVYLRELCALVDRPMTAPWTDFAAAVGRHPNLAQINMARRVPRS